MIPPKYFPVVFCYIIISCGNNPKNTKKSDAPNSDTSVDSSKKIANQNQIDTALEKFWTDFRHAIAAKQIDTFKQLLLDSLYTCDTILSKENFIKTCYNKVFDTTVQRKIVVESEINQINVTKELGYFRRYALEKADFKGATITLKQFQIVKEFTNNGAWTMSFDFMKTKSGYKFFGCDSYGGPICCR